MKHFVIAPTMDAYHAITAHFGLEPGACFYCDSLREALTDVARNRALGLDADIWDSTGRLTFPRFERALTNIDARNHAA